MTFDEYLFADYSGAFDAHGQRKSIRLAAASAHCAASIVDRSLTRDELVGEFVERFERASRMAKRICFGQDHQYGVPIGLTKEIGLSGRTWRQILESLATGGYGNDAPRFGHPRVFARQFNEWLIARGGRPYFYSATKSKSYGVPQQNPRRADCACYRLTELRRSESGAGSPKPFNRVGDSGTVGGQSLVGILAIRALLASCTVRRIPVAVWPFDGLSITDAAYSQAHVMIEPYPSAVRDGDVAQADDADALACANHVRQADLAGKLDKQLDLSSLSAADTATATLEGWILSHRSSNREFAPAADQRLQPARREILAPRLSRGR
jgi:hypothetical protein